MTDTTPRVAKAVTQVQAFCDAWLTLQTHASLHIPGIVGAGWTLTEPELRAVLNERGRLTARVAELESYAASLTGAVKAASDFGDAMERIRRLPCQTAATATANAELIARAVRQLHDAAAPVPCVYFDQPGHTPDQRPEPIGPGRGMDERSMCPACEAIARTDEGV